eukprot:m.83693 g.83693  ORF g.83693 m.83693 type:complete len:201 (-) comp16351_c0_seq9:3877-4479(-)
MQRSIPRVRHPHRAIGAPTHTVCFVMSDGDNLQWLLGPWATDPSWFASPQRGSVPISWTLSPALVDLAPAMLHYVQRHASPLDAFVVSPSGFGYTYPSKISNLPQFANLTASYMGQMGVDARVVNVIDQAYDASSLQEMLQYAAVDAVFSYTYGACYSGEQGAIRCVATCVSATVPKRSSFDRDRVNLVFQVFPDVTVQL